MSYTLPSDLEHLLQNEMMAGEYESEEDVLREALVALASRREMEETVADIRVSHVDIDAGRVASVSDTFADIRQQLDLE